MKIEPSSPSACSRPLAPRGGNDRVYTPRPLAKRIIDHFRPTGYICDPCKGEGAFYDQITTHTHKVWREIDLGSDFLTESLPWRFDWIITNPPWSQFRAFLQKSMEVADNVVFLALLNAWFMRARVADMRKAGFGIVEVLMVDTPPKPWPQTGFQLAAVHAKRGHRGPTIFSDENAESRHGEH